MTVRAKARSSRLLAVLVLVAVACVPACGGAGGSGRGAAGAEGLRTRGSKDRPPVSVVAREGDPRGAIAAAIVTAGVADARGADVAVGLSGLAEARLRAAGLKDAQVTATANGYRVRSFVATDADAAAFATALRSALLTPVTAADAEGLAAAQRKVTALTRRPLPDAALADVARCTGEAFGAPHAAAPRGAPVTAAELEAWRAAAHGIGRVALATAGAESLGDAAGTALARAAAWPDAPSRPAAVALPAADARAEIYELTPELSAGAARAHVAVFTQRPLQAVTVAAAIADARGAFVSRIGALEAGPRVRNVAATAHVGGGCVAVTLEWSARDLAVGGAARMATAIALARQELAVEIAEVPPDGTDASAVTVIAHAAEDPRDAAERAAFWSFASSRDDASLRTVTTVGIVAGKDTATDGAFAQRARDVRAALDRAVIAWHEPVVETRSRVEQGQGELWLLFASPCGTHSEGDADAGLSALVAAAAAEHVNDGLRGEGARAEGWATQEGVGIIVHGAARPSETPRAHARRLADAAARAFAAEALPAHAITRARAQVVARFAEQQDGARSAAVLASALAPGHPSWVLPWGVADAVGRASDASVAARATALRAGPLRVAVLANVDAAQAQAATQAIDRWIARRPGEARACPAASPVVAAKSGTYAADGTGGLAEAWIAAPLANGANSANAVDDDAREAASVLVAALDGDGGLLARAFEGTGLARATSARLLGGTRAPALVIRITTPPGSLDAAVAQVRAMLDRLRQGAFSDADRARAQSMREVAAVPLASDPRARLMALFRDDKPHAAPSLDALRALAAVALKDEALVIVAEQPRSVTPSAPGQPSTAPATATPTR